VNYAADSAPRPANLAATVVLDFHDAEIQRLASEFAQTASGEGSRLRRAHRHHEGEPEAGHTLQESDWEVQNGV
jgi:hypothetical protein